MVPEKLRARYRTAEQIRSDGAVGNLFDGVSITVHGLDTRLLAWPGTGYQTEAVHVTTVPPGTTGEEYTYDLAEEAILCRAGSAQVWLRDQWVTLLPGDIAYFPQGVQRNVRVPEDADGDAILVNQICPPQFDLYAPEYYNVDLGVINHDAVRKAATNAIPSPPATLPELELRTDQPEVRAQQLGAAEVSRAGALFNVLEGAAFSGIGLPMRLVLWPGAGTRLVGFNYAYCGLGVQDTIHTHPVSDEFLVMWSGEGQIYLGGNGWIDVSESDVAMAPCGVAHGHRSTHDRGPSMMGGFASPPQLDLLIPTPYYEDGQFTEPDPSALTGAEEHASDHPG